MRARLAFLLCLLMAYQSAMGAMALVPNCQMPAHEMSAHDRPAHEMADHHAMHASVPMDQAIGMLADHDCCQDAAGTSSASNLCDHHESCCSCGLTGLPSVQDLPPPLQASQARTDIQSRYLPRTPATVWRPPLFS